MILIFDCNRHLDFCGHDNWVMSIDSDSLTINDIKTIYFDPSLYSEGSAYLVPPDKESGLVQSSTNIRDIPWPPWTIPPYNYAILKMRRKEGRVDPYEINTHCDYVLIDTKLYQDTNIEPDDIQFGFVDSLVKTWLRENLLTQIGV